MTEQFNGRAALIVVSARVGGPTAERSVRLALDTGATWTVVSRRILADIGYDLATAERHMRIVTANGLQDVPMLRVDRLAALGSERHRFPLLCHTVPRASGVDGLLGLDFFRNRRLTIDFRAGEITLE
jgi:predicted aspartyl protease